VKGEIEKIWKNETADGRRYEVLQIGGQRYSLWEEDYLDKLQEGQPLEFDFRESGEFKNITKIYDQTGEEKQPGKEGIPPEYSDQRTRKTIRMSCLKSASRVLTGTKIPYKDRAEKAIEIAKKFEKYIDDEDLSDLDDDQKP
jgi:hypothetical protein